MAPPRPRWEANKKQAPAKAQKVQKVQKTKVADDAPTPSIPHELQQLLLNVFKNSFAERFAADIKPLLQEVKGHLYNRDFSTAFGKNEYLETYAARWSASRALGYADLLWDLRALLWCQKSPNESEEQDHEKRIVCLGGGAGAELVALAGVQRISRSTAVENQGATHFKLKVEAVDIADWTSVTEQLAKHITQAPPLSKYASAAIQAANTPLNSPDSTSVTFKQIDVLNADHITFSASVKDADIVTLMFTLNELYSTSLSLTQKFLLNLTSTVLRDTILLVVDSPGSYSTITLNGAEKKYPMQWLLDHTLLSQFRTSADNGKEEEGTKWEKIHEDASRWFRLDSTLQYPIELENMRMQVHMYRRL